jgi:hypothetical protein
MSSKRVILGLTEKLTILSPDNKEEKIVARIDTGATASSMDIKLAAKLKLGPVIKTKIVKSASGIKKRPIIKVKVKINGDIIEEEFTLADRSYMTYPLLVGQNILKKGNFLIDPNKN